MHLKRYHSAGVGEFNFMAGIYIFDTTSISQMALMSRDLQLYSLTCYIYASGLLKD